MAPRVASRGSDQFNLRFPEGLRDRIADAAEVNGRSMNSEIIARLERTFALQPTTADTLEDLRRKIDETRNLVGELIGRKLDIESYERRNKRAAKLMEEYREREAKKQRD